MKPVTMESPRRIALSTRADVLELLSDVEMARVSSAESSAGLGEGDEYLDLQHLDQGVLKAPSLMTPMAHALPRKAVLPKTWDLILAVMKTPAPAPAKPVATP